MIRHILSLINLALPKKKQIVIQGFPNIEDNALSIANCLAKCTDMPIYYTIDNSRIFSKSLLDKRIKIIYSNTLYFVLKNLTSKYIIFTHGSMLNKFHKKQVIVNLWHGIPYKPIGKLNNSNGILANITIATSPLSKQIFSNAFGVTVDKVYVTGYPRNDTLITSNLNKDIIKHRLDWDKFNKIIIWLPTFRKSIKGFPREDGIETGNAFYIKEFDLERFDNFLQENNILCIVKPHPMAPKYSTTISSKNLILINEKWLCNKNLSLYSLTGCCDLLISDVSSIIIDYLLIDKPIICISEDFEEYKKSRGFIFENIEDWIPAKICKNLDEFYEQLEIHLIENSDPFKDKRIKLKDIFHTLKDSESAKRISELMLKS